MYEVSSCCAPSVQSSCCEPAAKESCCGTSDAAAGGPEHAGCGCSAGSRVTPVAAAAAEDDDGELLVAAR